MTTVVSTVPFVMTTSSLSFLADFAAIDVAGDLSVDEATPTSYVVSSATLGITWQATGTDFGYTEFQPPGSNPPHDLLISGTVTGIEVTKPGGGYELSDMSITWPVDIIVDPFAVDTGGPVFGGDDTITGSESGESAPGFNDFLRGFDGNDTIHGRGGNDAIFGGNGNDILNGGAGNDFIFGDNEAGGTGDDTLAGGAGKDLLFGGDGADRFDFDSIKESKKGGQRDQIKDFSRSQGDKIDLEGIDAKSGSGNQAFKWIGKSDFHDKKGEVRYEDKGKTVIVQGDVNGDGKADFEIFVAIGALAKGDFVL